MSVEGPSPDDVAESDLRTWQTKLLPFMGGFVVLLTLLFVAGSAYDLSMIRRSIDLASTKDVEPGVREDFAKQTIPLTPSQMQAQSLIVLEAHALDNRYRQANALLMSRIWTKHMTFISGVILSFLGAVFILGKMEEAPSELSGEHVSWKVGVKSASPGIILVTLGTLLLVVAAAVQSQITVTDQPVFVAPVGTPASTESSRNNEPLPKPPIDLTRGMDHEGK